MIPLRVVAHTPSGFASNDPWSPSLDGVLAYWRLREQLGEEEFALGMTGHRVLVVPDDLPLERIEHDGAVWWACSSPILAGDERYLKWYHRRFDADAAVRFLDTPRTGRVSTSGGPYKAYRMAEQVTVTPTVTWHAMGERGEIERLLRRCMTIGRGGARGLGRVTRWDVTEDGDADLARLHRPLPVGYAELHGVEGPLRTWGIRPPGRMSEHQVMCVMP